MSGGATKDSKAFKRQDIIDWLYGYIAQLSPYPEDCPYPKEEVLQVLAALQHNIVHSKAATLTQKNTQYKKSLIFDYLTKVQDEGPKTREEIYEAIPEISAIVAGPIGLNKTLYSMETDDKSIMSLPHIRGTCPKRYYVNPKYYGIRALDIYNRF